MRAGSPISDAASTEFSRAAVGCFHALERSAAGADVLPGHPPRGVSREEHSNIGNVARISDAVERRHPGSLVAIAILHHVRLGWSGRDCIDRDAAPAKLPRQAPDKLLDGPFAAQVQRLTWEEQLLVFQPQEQFDRPRDSAMIAAG